MSQFINFSKNEIHRLSFPLSKGRKEYNSFYGYNRCNIIKGNRRTHTRMCSFSSARVEYSTALDIFNYIHLDTDYLPWKAASDSISQIPSVLTRTRPAQKLFKVCHLQIIWKVLLLVFFHSIRYNPDDYNRCHVEGPDPGFFESQFFLALSQELSTLNIILHINFRCTQA